jgi:hypothetical protein
MEAPSGADLACDDETMPSGAVHGSTDTRSIDGAPSTSGDPTREVPADASLVRARIRRQVGKVCDYLELGSSLATVANRTATASIYADDRSLADNLADLADLDDIQFFAHKDRSQEEFFHTLNELLEGQHQGILTCDRYPKEVEGLEDRLKSRFGWGLTVAIEPPELETCVAIRISKAQHAGVILPEDVALFIGKRIRSNVRELEGPLRRVIANSRFTGHPITIEFTKEALKDLLSLQAKLVTMENIRKTVADYYKVRVADTVSKRRSRSIARPRQVAMALAEELTSHSLQRSVKRLAVVTTRPSCTPASGSRSSAIPMRASPRITRTASSSGRMTAGRG